MKTSCFWSCVLALAAFSQPGLASLGGKPESIERDRHALGAEAAAKIASLPEYTVHEMKRDGTTIREYVSNSGVVFAVTWSGVTQPDLHQLLGTYQSEYFEHMARGSKKFGRRHARQETNHIIVEHWGHMRSLHGRAYVQALVPEGVKPDALE